MNNGINEKYFHQSTKEYDSNVIDDSIMSKSLSLSGGDEEKAKWKYIELRAERLSEDSSINISHKDGHLNISIDIDPAHSNQYEELKENIIL